MSDGALTDRLDQTIDAILSRADATAALKDPELAPLARIAADLRHCPSGEFKARLRASLQRRTAMTTAVITTRAREGFTTITPYLRVRDAAALIEFLSRVFAAVETLSTTGRGGGRHQEVRIGDSMIMIDEGGPEGVVPLRPAEFHVYVEDVDATFERAVAAGATSLGEPADRPYGERAGFVKDAYGNHWFIATHLGASYVPEGLRTVTPFLHLQSAAAYLDFLKQAFGAVEEGRHEPSAGRVVYARLRIGNAAIELGEADTKPMPGAFYLYVADADVLYEQALAAGAKSLWRPADQAYGDRVAGVEDSRGNQWFIARPAQQEA